MDEVLDSLGGGGDLGQTPTGLGDAGLADLAGARIEANRRRGPRPNRPSGPALARLGRSLGEVAPAQKSKLCRHHLSVAWGCDSHSGPPHVREIQDSARLGLA